MEMVRQKLHFWLLIASVGFLVGSSLFLFSVVTLYDQKLRVVFCDVGQGDAIYIRTPSGRDVLVDGGPDSQVLRCLGKHMPFWDHHIDLVALTHPQNDHLVGLLEVVERYQVDLLFDSAAHNTTSAYTAWRKQVDKAQNDDAKVYFPKAGSLLDFNDGVVAKLHWPQNGEVQNNDLNTVSLVMSFHYDDFCLFLTADAPVDILETINQTDCAIMKISHHGSKTGLSEELLNKVRPSLAVISVGERNRYGHPAPQVLDLLKQANTPVLRTDFDGAIEIVSDGKTWYYNKEK